MDSGFPERKDGNVYWICEEDGLRRGGGLWKSVESEWDRGTLGAGGWLDEVGAVVDAAGVEAAFFTS